MAEAQISYGVEDEPTTPFNKRLIILQNMCNRGGSGRRFLNAALQRNKCFTFQNPLKTLDLLRQVIQNSINKEIDAIIQDYMHQFFAPAIVNIHRNGNDISDEQIHLICRKMLDEAKKMYLVSLTAVRDNELCETYEDKATLLPKLINKNIPSPLRAKRKELGDSDTESDISQVSSISSSVYKQKRVRPSPKPYSKISVQSPSSSSSYSKMYRVPISDVSKWNPDRLNKDTLFILGSKANLALGLGAQRGRIYMKHPGLFRYNSDPEDIQWLYESNQKSVRFGGRAFFMVLNDVLELAMLPEYRSNPAVRLDDFKGFKLPETLLEKVKGRTSVIYDELRRKYDMPGVSAPEETTAGLDLSFSNAQSQLDDTFLSPDVPATVADAGTTGDIR